MPYTQQFGVSRLSPLNKFKEEKSDAPADDIIQQNNATATFSDVGMDVVNQLHDKWKSKSTLGKIGMVGDAVRTKGKSLMGHVDTSKLDSDKLDEAQDYVTIASGGVGLTGAGQPVSVAMDLGNAAFSGKRALDHFMSGEFKKGFKGIKDAGINLAGIMPVAGEYLALQKGGKYSKKAMTAADRFGGDVEGGAPGTRSMISTMSAPMSLGGKMAGWLARKFSD